MTNRLEKVNSLLAKEVAAILLKDLRIAGALVTVTRAETTANLIESRVYASVFPKELAERVMDVLRAMTADIQWQVNRKLRMRPVPRISFVLDEKPAQAARVEALLDKLKKEEK